MSACLLCGAESGQALLCPLCQGHQARPNPKPPERPWAWLPGQPAKRGTYPVRKLRDVPGGRPRCDCPFGRRCASRVSEGSRCSRCRVGTIGPRHAHKTMTPQEEEALDHHPQS